MIVDVRGEWKNTAIQELHYCSLQLTTEQTCILLAVLLKCCAQETLVVFFSFSVFKAFFILAFNISLLLGTDAVWIQKIKNNRSLIAHTVLFIVYTETES